MVHISVTSSIISEVIYCTYFSESRFILFISFFCVGLPQSFSTPLHTDSDCVVDEDLEIELAADFRHAHFELNDNNLNAGGDVVNGSTALTDNSENAHTQEQIEKKKGEENEHVSQSVQPGILHRAVSLESQLSDGGDTHLTRQLVSASLYAICHEDGKGSLEYTLLNCFSVYV